MLGLEKRAVVKLRRAMGEAVATQLPGESEYKFYKKAIAELAKLEYRWPQPEATVRDLTARLDRIEKAVRVRI